MTQIHVSGLLHRGDSKSVCVMIESEDKSMEVRMPEGEVLMCTGYTKEESEELLAYLNENIDDIMQTAKGVNPMKAFMS